MSTNVKSIPSIFFKIKLHIYYLDNCNLMIIPILLATGVFAFYMLQSSRNHSLYIKTKEISIKDKLINLRRKVQWIYDHYIFSFSLSLLYLTIFQILIYELSDLPTDNDANNSYAGISFGFSLVILFYIFAIFCS